MTPAKRSNLSLGALYIVLAMLGFAGMDAMSKWLVADYAIGQMMWIRYGVFCLFAWLVVRRTGPARGIPHPAALAAGRARRAGGDRKRRLRAGLQYLPLADTHALAATSPLIVIALGVLFLGERAGVARWLAVAAGFAGVLLIVRPGFRTFDWPLLLPLVGALPVGGLPDPDVRLCSRDDSPDTTLVWSAFVAFAATSFVGPFDWQWPDACSGTLLVAIALLGALAHYALIKALDYAEAGAVQPYSYTLLVWVTMLGAWCSATFPTIGPWWARRSSWRAGSTPGTTTGGCQLKRSIHCLGRATSVAVERTSRSAS